MKKLLVLIAVAYMVSACGTPYKEAIALWSDDKVCAKLGSHHLFGDDIKVKSLVGEVNDRQMDTNACVAEAYREITRLTPEYKLSRCQFLGQHFFQANYEAYKAVEKALTRNGMLDEECIEIANFHIRAMSANSEKRHQLLKTLSSNAGQPSTAVPLGSYFNPIYIKIKD